MFQVGSIFGRAYGRAALLKTSVNSTASSSSCDPCQSTSAAILDAQSAPALSQSSQAAATALKKKNGSINITTRNHANQIPCKTKATPKSTRQKSTKAEKQPKKGQRYAMQHNAILKLVSISLYLRLRVLRMVRFLELIFCNIIFYAIIFICFCTSATRY